MRFEPHDVNSPFPFGEASYIGVNQPRELKMASDNGPTSARLDEETGEVDQVVICLKSTPIYNDGAAPTTPDEDGNADRSRFRVPPTLNASATKRDSVYVQRELQINGVDLTVLNTQNLSPIAFIVPTLLLFPAWAAIMCAICEASIHIWFHKRNKMKKDDEMHYRSPLNLISSEFCAKCRTEKWMQQISNMQDKRSMRRNLIDPSFIKHVVR